MGAIARYTEALNTLNQDTANGSGSIIFRALEQFDAEDRKVIASQLHEVLEFNFDSFSAQDMVRRNLKFLSPEADLSWIPDWRDGYDADIASTQKLKPTE